MRKKNVFVTNVGLCNLAMVETDQVGMKMNRWVFLFTSHQRTFTLRYFVMFGFRLEKQLQNY